MDKIPEPFLEVRCTTVISDSEALTLCAGYESEKWRAKKLAAHIFSWLPQVALDQTRRDSFDTGSWLERIEDAAAHVYRTKKTERRGEIGEILLHIACVQEFGSLPVLCKLVLKTSHNDTVKGFDAVHVVATGDDFELWLGESKFYKNPKSAISEALKSVREHLLPSFLDTEKAMIYGHIPDGVPNAEEIRKLFKKNTSSDKLLERAVFPVLIAYESTAVASHISITEEFRGEVEAEVKALHQIIFDNGNDIKVKLQVIFVPMHIKKEVVKYFDQKLEAFA